MFSNNVRSYEVSIWTLQDSFITTLKVSNLESKGQIQDAKMHLSDDGTQEFTFTLPMYIYEGPNRIENPNWYNVRNGNLIANMRKIKVIFNKKTDVEQVFEFLIIKVTERHDNGELMCDVECEGLAFHELGKIGYKISLSQDDYLEEWADWSTEIYDTTDEKAVTAHAAKEPKNNINYWMDKVLKNTNWTYSIQMDWSGIDGMVIVQKPQYEPFPNSVHVNSARVYDPVKFSESYPMVNWAIVDKAQVYNGELFVAEIIPYGKLEDYARDAVNEAREAKGLRRCDKIYEDEYVSSWGQENDVLTPLITEKRREKYRLFDESESNIYNLTQTIAETFGVYCKYIYHYDNDYRIIGREVVFYNNFLQESTGEISITYPYQTTNIEREMDGTDIVTKMYVKTLDDNTTESGWASIMLTSANKTGEDYLLDFDYLYEIGTISEQQYREIEKYELQMHDLNLKMVPLENQITRYNNELVDVSAAKTIAQNAMALDDERMSAADDLLMAVSDGTGILHRTAANPDTGYLIKESKESNRYHYTFRQLGIIVDTLHIYREFKSSLGELTNEIVTYEKEYDECNNLIGIYVQQTDKDTTKIYIIYDYEPTIYYDNVKKTWQLRKVKDEAEYNKQLARANELDGEKDAEGNRVSDGLIQKAEKELEDLRTQKELLDKAFERMMGPALREGNWQPEDDYANYGDKYSLNLFLNNESLFNHTDIACVGWGSDLFDDEQKNYYEEGVEQSKVYYPCVDLTNYISRFTNARITATVQEQEKENGLPLKDNITISNLSFVFQDIAYANIEDPRFFRYFSVGSQCELAFIRKEGEQVVKPVLMITGIETLGSDFDITDTSAHAKIGYLDISVDESGVTNKVLDIITEAEIEWVPKDDLEYYKIVYPRVRINSSNLKTSEDEFSLMLDNEILTNYNDYYLLSREEINLDGQPVNCYYFTIKPQLLFTHGKINSTIRCNFSISNTSLLIYLDALQVLKENAYPKVTYTVDPSIMTPEFVRQAYSSLDKIIRLNDDELKFEDVRGYISELDLDLDHPQDDEITITNYKTKFEDLFSNIVAETQEMKKNSYVIGMAANLFTDTGGISPDAIQGVITRADLNYAFNQGALTINEADGIWGTSDDGVVAFRGGGIFTATEKDPDGNWVWNTGVLPSGINANLITTGQLDTNLVKIFAGNDLKFQLNGRGLFAYKSWLEDDPVSAEAQNSTYYQMYLDPGQYVVHDSEGLFLVAKKGTKILVPKTVVDEKTGQETVEEEYKTINEDINRVSISWDGFTIRNWDNEKVFYADGEGNLTLKGTIYADAGEFTGKVTAKELLITTEYTVKKEGSGDSNDRVTVVEDLSADDFVDVKLNDFTLEFGAQEGELWSIIEGITSGLQSSIDQNEGLIDLIVSRSATLESSELVLTEKFINMASEQINLEVNKSVDIVAKGKKWFTFNEDGLTIRKPAITDPNDESMEISPQSHWFTVTDENGYHIYCDLLSNIKSEQEVGSFYRNRLKTTGFESGKLLAKATDSGGWAWIDNDSDI